MLSISVVCAMPTSRRMMNAPVSKDGVQVYSIQCKGQCNVSHTMSVVQALVHHRNHGAMSIAAHA